jgi:hypothetical protein
MSEIIMRVPLFARCQTLHMLAQEFRNAHQRIDRSLPTLRRGGRLRVTMRPVRKNRLPRERPHVTQHVLLNNADHRDLRVILTPGAQYGDDVMYALTFPAEFRHVQAHYPILFAKGRDGEFNPLALFGFREKQNLFLDGDRWDASYLPLMIERQPFLIGNSANGQVIHIDLDSPRVSRTMGEPVFLENGGNSEFLERVGSILVSIHEGLAANAPFIAALTKYNLLESFVLDIEFRDGLKHRFAGFFTIQEERLNALDAGSLYELHKQGFLSAIYMVLASLANFRELIERASRLNATER